MTSTVRRTAWIAAALSAVGATALMLRPAPMDVDTAEVRRAPLLVTVDDEGRTRVRDRYVVAAPAAGLLERLPWRAGDRVAAGQVVARIRPALAAPLDLRTTAQLRARMAAAEDEVMRARAARDAAVAEQEYARADASRATRLSVAGALSQAQAEEASTALRTAQERVLASESAVRVAEHALQEARAALQAPAPGAAPRGGVTVRAPAGGAVLRVIEDQERTGTAGTPLVELGDPASLEVVVDLLSSDAVRVRAGADAFIEGWGDDEVLRGRVRRVEPSSFTKVSALGVEEQRVNVILDLETGPGAGRLGDGYAVDVRIVVDRREAALVVPAGALLRDGGASAVYVVRDGRARVQRVVTGARAAFHVEILSGVEPGVLVVLYPGDRVSDGTRVVARTR